MEDSKKEGAEDHYQEKPMQPAKKDDEDGAGGGNPATNFACTSGHTMADNKQNDTGGETGVCEGSKRDGKTQECDEADAMINEVIESIDMSEILAKMSKDKGTRNVMGQPRGKKHVLSKPSSSNATTGKKMKSMKLPEFFGKQMHKRQPLAEVNGDLQRNKNIGTGVAVGGVDGSQVARKAATVEVLTEEFYEPTFDLRISQMDE